MRNLFNLILGKEKKEVKKAGAIAEERLKLVLSRNKLDNSGIDYKAMETEIIEVVKKFIPETQVSIQSETENNTESLSIEVKF